MIIQVCMGSSCYLKSSFEIIKKLEELQNDGLEINLFGHLCFGSCADGICVKLGDDLIYGVTPANIETVLIDRIKGLKNE